MWNQRLNYLITKGINKDRMVSVGYGETKLLNDCSDEIDCTEAEHQLNRRTTFRVLKTDYKR
jgi:outer membrane protein OmpA-like peptidoglycan-associated protein